MTTKQHSVTIYSTPTCPFCVLAKKFFAARDVSYTDIDVSQNEDAARQMIEKSGQMGVPVIDIDDTIVVGYQPEVFAHLLHLDRGEAHTS